jgi:hypothetical protein
LKVIKSHRWEKEHPEDAEQIRILMDMYEDSFSYWIILLDWAFREGLIDKNKYDRLVSSLNC